MILSMGWVNYPDFFFSAFKTVVDNANAYMLDLNSIFNI